MSDIEIEVEIRGRSKLALLVSSDGDSEAWVPKSQISDYTGPNVDEAESIFIPEWLATEKGLI